MTSAASSGGQLTWPTTEAKRFISGGKRYRDSVDTRGSWSAAGLLDFTEHLHHLDACANILCGLEIKKKKASVGTLRTDVCVLGTSLTGRQSLHNSVTSRWD